MSTASVRKIQRSRKKPAFNLDSLPLQREEFTRTGLKIRSATLEFHRSVPSPVATPIKKKPKQTLKRLPLKPTKLQPVQQKAKAKSTDNIPNIQKEGKDILLESQFELEIQRFKARLQRESENFKPKGDPFLLLESIRDTVAETINQSSSNINQYPKYDQYDDDEEDRGNDSFSPSMIRKKSSIPQSPQSEQELILFRSESSSIIHSQHTPIPKHTPVSYVKKPSPSFTMESNQIENMADKIATIFASKLEPMLTPWNKNFSHTIKKARSPESKDKQSSIAEFEDVPKEAVEEYQPINFPPQDPLSPTRHLYHSDEDSQLEQEVESVLVIHKEMCNTQSKIIDTPPEKAPTLLSITLPSQTLESISRGRQRFLLHQKRSFHVPASSGEDQAALDKFLDYQYWELLDGLAHRITLQLIDGCLDEVEEIVDGFVEAVYNSEIKSQKV